MQKQRIMNLGPCILNGSGLGEYSPPLKNRAWAQERAAQGGKRGYGCKGLKERSVESSEMSMFNQNTPQPALRGKGESSLDFGLERSLVVSLGFEADRPQGKGIRIEDQE